MTHSYPPRRSSDLATRSPTGPGAGLGRGGGSGDGHRPDGLADARGARDRLDELLGPACAGQRPHGVAMTPRSVEHTSELQSIMRISFAVFCLKKHKRI